MHGPVKDSLMRNWHLGGSQMIPEELMKGHPRSGACGWIWLNTEELTRCKHSYNWQIKDLSWFFGWWCMDFLSEWTNLLVHSVNERDLSLLTSTVIFWCFEELRCAGRALHWCIQQFVPVRYDWIILKVHREGRDESTGISLVFTKNPWQKNKNKKIIFL